MKNLIIILIYLITIFLFLGEIFERNEKIELLKSDINQLEFQNARFENSLEMLKTEDSITYNKFNFQLQKTE